MVELLLIALGALVVVAATTALSDKFGIPAPLLQIAVGVAFDFLPFVHPFSIDPEIVLMVILPPLLYSAAVNMPAMTLRREFTAISGLSVVLVVLTTVGLGAFLSWVIPGLDFWWAVAIGAVISPTDAVATSIVKRAGAGKRIVGILEGESLLNDASALVLLKTAIAAAAVAFSFWGALGSFAWSVFSAVVVGLVGGWLALLLRKRVHDSAVDTVVSFIVPFAVALPVDAIGGSGLVAAVVAGIVHSQAAPKYLSALQRTTAAANWRTASFVLEAFVFLIMGAELRAIWEAVGDESGTGTRMLLLALAALAIVLVIRAVFVFAMLGQLARRNERRQRVAPRLDAIDAKIADGHVPPSRTGRRSPEEMQRYVKHRVNQARADLAYFAEQPLTWRDGTIIVWAGMRGAVTVAAAQTIPDTAALHNELVLFAYCVAFFSLLIQGGTIAAVARALLPQPTPEEVRAERAAIKAERAELQSQMKAAADAAKAAGTTDAIGLIRAQRFAVLRARSEGGIDPEVLDWALHRLDAREVAAELDDE